MKTEKQQLCQLEQLPAQSGYLGMDPTASQLRTRALRRTRRNTSGTANVKVLYSELQGEEPPTVSTASQLCSWLLSWDRETGRCIRGAGTSVINPENKVAPTRTDMYFGKEQSPQCKRSKAERRGFLSAMTSLFNFSTQGKGKTCSCLRKHLTGTDRRRGAWL